MDRNPQGQFIKGHIGSPFWLGKKMSIEARQKMSMAKKGKKLSEEHKQKLVASLMGRPVSSETRKKIGDSQRGILHYGWKGDKVKYRGLHTWINKNYGRPFTCEECDGVKSKFFEWANISQKYKRARDDWEMLCRSCHMEKDGRSERTRKQLLTIGRGRYG